MTALADGLTLRHGLDPDSFEHRDEDHRHVCGGGVLLQAAAHVEAVKPGHHDVEQNEIDVSGGDPLEHRGTRRRLHDVEFVFERAADDDDVGRYIVGDKNAGLPSGLRRRNHTACGGRRPSAGR